MAIYLLRYHIIIIYYYGNISTEISQVSEGKSGSFFFYSHDGSYLVKTMSKTEFRFSRSLYPRQPTTPHCTALHLADLQCIAPQSQSLAAYSPVVDSPAAYRPAAHSLAAYVPTAPQPHNPTTPQPASPQPAALIPHSPF